MGVGEVMFGNIKEMGVGEVMFGNIKVWKCFHGLMFPNIKA